MNNIQRRKYADSGLRIRPKTYFQDDLPPPPQQRRPSRFWRVVRGSAIAITAFGAGLLTDIEFGYGDTDVDENSQQLGPLDEFFTVITAHHGDWTQFARTVLGPKAADQSDAAARLGDGRGVAVHPGIIAHSCDLPSNIISQVALTCCPVSDDCFLWGIFDGHTGASTAKYLSNAIPNTLRDWLRRQLSLEVDPDGSSKNMASLLTYLFYHVDNELVQSLEQAIASTVIKAEDQPALRVASSGSSALLALYDQADQRLWVANAGNSRAVGGSWSTDHERYVAVELSSESVGRNTEEADIVQGLHPDEQIFDPRSGDLLGLPVTRALGDAGWKMSNEQSQSAYETYATPRPSQPTRTPPYIIAHPSIQECTIDHDPKPDFMIMATRGFWDKMSSEDAVQCVKQWMDQFDLLETAKTHAQAPMRLEPFPDGPDYDTLPKAELRYDNNSDKITWKQSSDYWVVERTNCAEHLVQNALGGTRRSLVTMLINTPPPFSSKYYDDISVVVVFFSKHNLTVEDLLVGEGGEVNG